MNREIHITKKHNKRLENKKKDVHHRRFIHERAERADTKRSRHNTRAAWEAMAGSPRSVLPMRRWVD